MHNDVIHHGNRITDQEESKVSSTAIDVNNDQKQKQKDTDIEGNSIRETMTASFVEPVGKRQEAKETKKIPSSISTEHMTLFSTLYERRVP